MPNDDCDNADDDDDGDDQNVRTSECQVNVVAVFMVTRAILKIVEEDVELVLAQRHYVKHWCM